MSGRQILEHFFFSCFISVYRQEDWVISFSFSSCSFSQLPSFFEKKKKSPQSSLQTARRTKETHKLLEECLTFHAADREGGRINFVSANCCANHTNLWSALYDFSKKHFHIYYMLIEFMESTHNNAVRLFSRNFSFGLFSCVCFLSGTQAMANKSWLFYIYDSIIWMMGKPASNRIKTNEMMMIDHRVAMRDGWGLCVYLSRLHVFLW